MITSILQGVKETKDCVEKMNGCRIFIGRLNPSAREKDVERFFKGYGRIRDIDLKRGFGFVVRRNVV